VTPAVIARESDEAIQTFFPVSGLLRFARDDGIRPEPAIASGDAERAHPESAGATRSKKRFWRAAMRREAGKHENIFIAKSRDSESPRLGFGAIDEP
jgi:hypothetical protein